MPGTPVSRHRNRALLTTPARTARPKICGMARYRPDLARARPAITFRADRQPAAVDRAVLT